MIGYGIAKTEGFFAGADREMGYFKLRMGVDIEITPRIDLGLYLDHISIFRDLAREENLHFLTPTIGITLYFGDPNPPAPPETKTAEAPKGAEKSSKVDLDSDADGVADSKDRCPGSPKGSAVNELGCALKQSFEISLDVKFVKSTAKFVSATQPGIEELAKILRENKELRVELEGHTDNRGKNNRALSLARAQAVREALIRGHGIEAGRLSARGYGSSRPVAGNETEESRALNRRVTARVLR
jgi:outer membrane protein OmpA-like peptidoglycan-associated protein